jgi:hypothetical protein
MAAGASEESLLNELLAEALKRSPLIIAARQHWQAETRMPIQERTLPDPQITFQNLAVGNPIPGNSSDTRPHSRFVLSEFGPRLLRW